MTGPTRPILRYHGGKWRIAPWIISHFPEHRVYVEPFGGAGSVLLRKPRSYAEVYNDLDGEVVNVFRVLRDPVGAKELVRQMRLTPYSRLDFELSYEPIKDPVEQARRTLLRSAAGFGSVSASGRKTGFRSNVTREYTTPASDWTTLPEQILSYVERMQGVVIENRPAAAILTQFDGPETLHYIDPPYPHATRTNTSQFDQIYRHEMSDADHRELAELLHSLHGAVIISGYACPLYDDLYPAWTRTEINTRAGNAAMRTETLWLNPRASRARRTMGLFEEGVHG